MRMNDLQTREAVEIDAAYFDEAMHLIYADRSNTFAFNYTDGTFVSTCGLASLNKYSGNSCVGISGGSVLRWSYLDEKIDIVDIPNIDPYSVLYFNPEEGVGVLANWKPDGYSAFLQVDTSLRFQELLRNNDSEFLLKLITTKRGLLVCTGVGDEFSTNQIRYLDRFDEPIKFFHPTVIFPQYMYRYEQRAGKKSGFYNSNRILTYEDELVFEVETRSTDLFFRMAMNDGVHFIAYYQGRLLLFSAAEGKAIAELPRRSRPLMQCQQGGFLFGWAYVGSDDANSEDREYWIFDLQECRVTQTIRLSDAFDRAVCNSDGSKIFLYQNADRNSRNARRSAILDIGI